MDEVATRGNVRYWMQRRGLTVPQFAAQCGRSPSWAEKILSGRLKLNKVETLELVSKVLGVETDVLADRRCARLAKACPDVAEIDAIRQALQRVDAITGLYGAADRPQPDMPRLHRQVGYLWTSFQNSGYSVLGEHLPRLLVQAQDAAAAAGPESRAEADSLLSLAYQLTASMLWKLREPDLAWLAAERALSRAERCGDPLLISDAARRVAHGLLATDHPGAALALIRADMDRLDDGLPGADDEYLSVYGMLPLMGAVVAGRSGNPGAARDLLAESADAGKRVGRDLNEHWTAFGPTNVAVHRTSVLVDLADGPAAVQAAAAVTAEGLGLLPRERRASHLLDVARAYALCGDRVQAVEYLASADRTATEEIRCRPVARDLIADLMETWPRQAPPALRSLAASVGLPV
jgi:transcriptional regulator with XRE-family HTH domain